MFDKSFFDIHFFFQKALTLKDGKRLKTFLSSLLQTEAFAGSGKIDFVFCSDEELLSINRKFLQHDFYTDIITFEFSKPNSKYLDAEIYISVDRVKDNAKHLKLKFNTELHRVIFHGVLHLCGYVDKTPVQLKKMRNAEDFYLEKYIRYVSRDTVSA